ncbi:MAG: transposase [Cyclobacteriaceae bacterium]|nr:transposase [Cyclobacteriaceae bacterium]
MKFESNNFYHIYNRGNNKQPVLFKRESYLFFLSKVRKHLSPLVDILAYCLMPNHFHLMVYVPEKHNTRGTNLSRPENSCYEDDEYIEYDSKAINKNLGIILSSYTKAINNRYGRTGSLFQAHTKAKNVSKHQQQAFICFHYIHQNPLKAKLVNKMEDWEFSSYQDYLGIRNGTLCNKQLAFELLDIPQKPYLFQNQSKAVIINSIHKASIF